MSDYPDEIDLEKISTLGNGDEPVKLVYHLKEIWHWSHYLKWDGETLELHTGGWSGNEDIISALNGTLFWFLYWQKSERGGHYYFKIPCL